MENKNSWELDVETVMHPLRRISGNKEKKRRQRCHSASTTLLNYLMPSYGLKPSLFNILSFAPFDIK